MLLLSAVLQYAVRCGAQKPPFEVVDVFEALLDACPFPSAEALPLRTTGKIREEGWGGRKREKDERERESVCVCV